jgi:hypothetical protein
VGAETRPGAELAARIGDGWTTPAESLSDHLPAYLAALDATGRDRASQRILAAFALPKGAALAGSPWVVDPAGTAARWSAMGADGAVVAAADTADVDALVGAAGRR